MAYGLKYFIFGVSGLSLVAFAEHDLSLMINALNERAVQYVGKKNPVHGNMQLELLKREGLNSNHYVLDIGCGALYAGIPIMSFLEPGHYVGVEPNRWLIQDTLSVDQNKKVVERYRPKFLYNDQFDAQETEVTFDYILSHSVMSHAAHWQLPLFLKNCAKALKKGGKVVFSIRLTEPNAYGSQGANRETRSHYWIYPGNSFFDKKTVIKEAKKYFSNVNHKKHYTKLITSVEPPAFHDWFVLTK